LTAIVAAVLAVHWTAAADLAVVVVVVVVV
jgi:hypothetical protein